MINQRFPTLPIPGSLGRYLRVSPLKLNPWIILILLIGLLTYSCAVCWGLPADSSWAADSIHPSDVIERTKSYPYPPLHFYILYITYYPFIVAAKLGWIDLFSISITSILIMLGRAVSVLMALGIIINVYLTSLEINKNPVSALLSAAFILGNAPLVYYSKTMNVEVPYIFWFSLSMIFYIRAIKLNQITDYSWFAVTAMFAICTKDQAYGLIVIPSVFLAYRCFRYHHRRKLLRLLIPTAIGLVTFSLIHNLIFDFPTFESHFNLLGKAGYTPTDFTDTHHPLLQRYAYLVYRFIKDVKFNLGWPMSLLALVSIGTSLFRKKKPYLLLCLLIPCLSYYILFLSLIMYSRDRFVLPICLIFCIFCGHFLSDILERFNQTSIQISVFKYGVLTILLVYTFLYANSVNLLMLSDSRYFVEKWMLNNIRHPTEIGYVEKKRNHPRFNAIEMEETTVTGVLLSDLKTAVEKKQFSYLITSSGYTVNRFPKGTREFQGFGKLQDGKHYKLIFCHRSTPAWNFLDIEEPTPSEYYDPRRKTGNLNKINPEICIYEKLDPLNLAT